MKRKFWGTSKPSEIFEYRTLYPTIPDWGSHTKNAFSPFLFLSYTEKEGRKEGNEEMQTPQYKR
jgi:hypothetical protein